jgi:hypothetical protein
LQDEQAAFTQRAKETIEAEKKAKGNDSVGGAEAAKNGNSITFTISFTHHLQNLPTPSGFTHPVVTQASFYHDPSVEISSITKSEISNS